ncbi:MAG: DUF87 domain-containing protein [Methanobacteriaceae archaeon]|nr:DUF87 domain-containing protein [Methanobacteriaceae archaeon]MDO9626148.1 DUF87 domain-containing protein [Methanobacteriaceae archaeon]
MDKIGQIVGGGLNNIYIRGKSGEKLELGDLLVSESKNKDKNSIIFQVKDIEYKSQLSASTHEMVSGLELEGFGAGLNWMEPELRNYVVAKAKPLLEVGKDGNIKSPKKLPDFFNYVRIINSDDLGFLETKDSNDYLHLGKVRSGSEQLDVDVSIDATKALTHHMLIPATTGRGKSNLVKVILWGLIESENTGILVLDPHNEYYGDTINKGLRDHPESQDMLDYYSVNSDAMGESLIISVKNIRPENFNGIFSFTSAQSDAMYALYNHFREDWILKIIEGIDSNTLSKIRVRAETINVIERKLDRYIGIYLKDDKIRFRSNIFKGEEGINTIENIINSLEEGKIVIIDTSKLSDSEELFIGSIISGRVLNKYKNFNSSELENKPVISIVIEEAPRVLGKDAFQGQMNIYSTIAKEGRKFKIGLIAITQLASVIPRPILANMNTKIILGNEMNVERSALIDSAAQDLSEDNRIIASLDKGQAIVSSVFTKFAIPIQIPFFDEYVDEYLKNNPPRKRVTGKIGLVGT